MKIAAIFFGVLLFASTAYARTTINSLGIVSDEPIRGRNLLTSPSVTVSTIAPLPVGIYANGTAGVGATFTVTATGILVVDGITTLLNDLILVQNQILTVENGVYKVTTAGAAGVSAVLTRDISADQAAEIPGSVVFVAGGTKAGSSYIMATLSAITVGTTSITYTQSVGASGNLTGAITSVGLATVLGSFTSLDLSVALTDETGTGSAVFGLNPTLITPTITTSLTGSTTLLISTRANGALTLTPDGTGTVIVGKNLTADVNNTVDIGTDALAFKRMRTIEIVVGQ